MYETIFLDMKHSFKALPGRSAKTSMWTEDLHTILLTEFEKIQEMGFICRRHTFSMFQSQLCVPLIPLHLLS